jgi:hypothetical protein
LASQVEPIAIRSRDHHYREVAIAFVIGVAAAPEPIGRRSAVEQGNGAA